MQNENAKKKIASARVALVLNEPFFGSLSLRMAMIEDGSIKTLCTNGKAIRYNSNFVESLPHDILVSAICHEVLHVALGHAWRRDARNAKLWNVAGDYEVNQVLLDSGMKLGEDWLIDPLFKGLTAEPIYTRLDKPKDEGDDDDQGEDSQDSQGEDNDAQGEGEPEGSDEPQGPGDVEDCPDGEEKELEAEWKVATIQAANAAKAQGKLPGSLKGLVDALRETKTDWRAYTLRFAQERAASDYTMRVPNRRFVQSGLYLPALQDVCMGEIIIAVDTSGSCSDAIPAFGAHLQVILDTVRPRVLHVVYADDGVQHVDTYAPGDTVKVRRDGGGGTSFVPPFQWIAAQGIEPACMIYLTDLYGTFPAPADFPVLWASVTKNLHAPFGETIYIKD